MQYFSINCGARKRNRLQNYDYSNNGWYFVTICVKNRNKIFGKIKNGKIVLNEYGKIVNTQWSWLKAQYNYIKLDEYILMPDHIHGIIVITNNHSVGAGRDLPLQSQQKIKSLPELIGAFKTTSSKIIHRNGLKNFAWQRSFYDSIIHDETSLENIREYIRNNTRISEPRRSIRM